MMINLLFKVVETNFVSNLYTSFYKINILHEFYELNIQILTHFCNWFANVSIYSSIKNLIVYL